MMNEYQKICIPPLWDGKAGRRIVNVMRLCQNQFVCEPIHSLLIVFGLIVVAISILADFIGVGHPGFGIEQLSGLIIGLFLSVAGLLRVHLTSTKILARVLGVIYVSGVLYVGLRPHSFKPSHYKVLLDVSGFEWHDFAINTVGFILLGYLFMLSFGIRQKGRKAFSLVEKAIVVAIAGGIISLFVEASQYYLISGRHSSFIDLTANTVGTLIGITMYLAMEQERTHGDSEN